MEYGRKVYYLDTRESLTGKVNGEDASDIEERAARALSKLQIPFSFRARINPLAGVTQERQNIIGEVEIDFLADYYSKLYPINIAGEISHFFTKAQAVKDERKEIKINTALAPLNAHPLIVIPFVHLTDQESADRLIRYGFMNGWPQEMFFKI